MELFALFFLKGTLDLLNFVIAIIISIALIIAGTTILVKKEQHEFN